MESSTKLFAACGTGNGTIASQQIAGLGLESESFGCRVKFLTGLGAFDKFFGFVASKGGCFFAFQFGDDFVANFLESGLVRRQNSFQGKNDVTTVRSNGEAQLSR